MKGMKLPAAALRHNARLFFAFLPASCELQD